MSTAATAEQVHEVYRHAHGTGQYHRLSMLPGILCTDSIKELADIAGAYWVIDLITSYNPAKFRKAHPFQFWKMKVEDNKAMITMREDSGKPIVVSQMIQYTDFPPGTWEFWVVEATPEYSVLMSPGDY